MDRENQQEKSKNNNILTFKIIVNYLDKIFFILLFEGVNDQLNLSKK
jgi:hypothetical protein